MDLKGMLKKVAPDSVRAYVSDIQGRLAKLEDQARRIDAQQSTISMLETTLDKAISTPMYEAGDDIGFNGQRVRKQIFRDVLSRIAFNALVETGTWTGDTTGFMASTAKIPVFTGELSYRFHSLARKRLVDFPGVTLRHADSRKFLQNLAMQPNITDGPTFFYLDAHWYADLPLVEEIDLIADAWGEFVIMIDDFQVPGDEGYGYDDYGTGKALTMEYLAGVMKSRNLVAYFPSTSSADDTGHKRGCVVLARRGETSSVLDSIGSLRRG